MSLNFKIALFVACCATLLGFYTYQQRVAFQAGYDKAQAEMAEQFYNDLEAMVRAKSEQVKIASEKADKWRKEAIRLQQQDPVTVIEYVPTIIEKNPDCTRIDGFSIMLNELQKNFD